MSRPQNPSWTVPVWAPNANYPAGANPWSGTPTKTTHPAASTVGATPKQGVAAQVFNKIVNDAYSVDQSAKDTIAALVTHVGQLQPKNWTVPSSTTTIRRVAFDPNRQIWYALANAAAPLWSGDAGRSWTALSPGFTGGSAVGVDAAGNVVVMTASTNIWEFAKSTNTWTNRTAVILGTPAQVNAAGGNPNVFVVHEPNAALWCSVYFDSTANIIRIVTSSNRSTWSSRTVPAGASGSWSPCAMAVGNGRIVALAQNTISSLAAPTSFKILSSGDGGVTWSDDLTISFSGSTTARASIAYSSTDGAWLLCIGNSTAGTSVLYRSTNGTSWTLVTSSTLFSFQRVTAVGRLWVAVGDHASANGAGDSSVVLYSYDIGATWRRACALNSAGLLNELLSGGGAIVAVTNDSGSGGATRGSIVCDEGPTVTV